MSSRSSAFFRNVTCLTSLGALLLLAAGCETPPGGATTEAVQNVQVPLEGTALLFGETIEMQVALAPFFTADPLATRRRGAPDAFRSRARPEEEFGLLDPNSGPRRRVGMQGGALAPATHRLRVRFTNRSDKPLTFDVYEVRSALGIFGVRPNRLTLSAGATQEIDPMRPSIGENFEQLDVFVTVRHRSKTETVSVRLTPAAAEPQP